MEDNSSPRFAPGPFGFRCRRRQYPMIGSFFSLYRRDNLTYIARADHRGNIPSQPLPKYRKLIPEKGFSKQWHGTIQGQIKAFGHTLQIHCHVYCLRGDGSCAFYGFIEGAHNITLDPEFITRQGSIELSHPTFIKRLKILSKLYEEDSIECPLTRHEICKFMLDKCKGQPGAYSNLWTFRPENSALANGLQLALLWGIDVPSGNLGRGEMWALSVLDKDTQFDEGYGRVLVDYLDGAVVFPVILKQHPYSNDSRVTRSSVPTEPVAELRGPEFVHFDETDIEYDGNKVPLAAWLLHQTMKPQRIDESNEKSHFELLSRVLEHEQDGKRSPLIFLDPRVECVESGGGTGRHASGTGPGDGGGRRPSRSSDDYTGESSSRKPHDSCKKSSAPSTNGHSTSVEGGVSHRHSPQDGAAGDDGASTAIAAAATAASIIVDLTNASPNKVHMSSIALHVRQTTDLEISFTCVRGLTRLPQLSGPTPLDCLPVTPAPPGAAPAVAGEAAKEEEAPAPFAPARADIADTASGYKSFPSHRVLVLDEVHWDAFKKQFKLVEFRSGSRRNIITGMCLLLSRRLALRRKVAVQD